MAEDGFENLSPVEWSMFLLDMADIRDQMPKLIEQISAFSDALTDIACRVEEATMSQLKRNAVAKTAPILGSTQ